MASRLSYHAGMDSNTRSYNQDMFLMEEVDVIVAYFLAFGMGIDKPDREICHPLRHSKSAGYYQETGRAGRDDQEGQCIAFYEFKGYPAPQKIHAGQANFRAGDWKSATDGDSCLCRIQSMPASRNSS